MGLKFNPDYQHEINFFPLKVIQLYITFEACDKNGQLESRGGAESDMYFVSFS
jgi:hypothetical protein